MDSPTEKRILVVDDNPEIANLVREALCDEGYEAEALLEARGLLAAAKRLRPNLILLDVVMPYADIRDQLAQLRADEQTRPVPVILVTADTNTAYDLASLEAVVGVALKPFDLDNLLAKIAAALGQQSH